MKIKVIHKKWMEEMTSVDLKYNWCCSEAKKHLHVCESDGDISFAEYYVGDGGYQSYKDVFIHFCPFCGEKFEVINE